MTSRFSAATLVVVAAVGVAACAQDATTYEIELLSVLEDKIRGGWAGQMIGVSFGEPTEFRYLDGIIPEDELPEWRPEMVVSTLNQDDLYVDMTFAAVLDEKGLDATTDDLTSPPSTTTAAAVSSQLVSMPRIVMCLSFVTIALILAFRDVRVNLGIRPQQAWPSPLRPCVASTTLACGPRLRVI